MGQPIGSGMPQGGPPWGVRGLDWTHIVFAFSLVDRNERMSPDLTSSDFSRSRVDESQQQATRRLFSRILCWPDRQAGRQAGGFLRQMPLSIQELISVGIIGPAILES